MNLVQLQQFIRDNLLWLIIFAVVYCLFMIRLRQWRRSRRDLHFPPLETVTVLFREHSASGYSHLSLLTRFGGARNCLQVTLTDAELWVTTYALLRSLAEFYDLHHRIPLEDVLGVQQKGNTVALDFVAFDRERRRISIRLRRATEFVDAIRPRLRGKDGN